MLSQHLIDRLIMGGVMVAVFLLVITILVVLIRKTGGDVDEQVEGIKKYSEKHQHLKQELEQSQNKNAIMEKLLTLSEEERKSLLLEMENTEKKKDSGKKS